VRHRIKTLIENETADAVLSDDRIAEILKEDGIDIARRTVAKYREAMKISSSSQRRREIKPLSVRIPPRKSAEASHILMYGINNDARTHG
jgi:hypothetical protein